ncbi:MAG: hypothetical protein K0R61_740 [Microvirga sp.]|nr:hypothetical protein [Microvirga sp.]MCD6071001.1 hypothetical protein [Microvirga sp.]MDF2970290.1 hypothetical protein [Microvirga sp.]
MIDKSEHEEVALDYASDMAGEYLDELDITDMAKMTREQWMTLIECAVTGFTDKLKEIEIAAPGRY